MLAYHNDESLKQSVLADRCLIKSGQYAEYEKRFGIPIFLARLEDGIFEGLPVVEAKLWPKRFFGAIRTGADLSMVFYRFMHWLLVDEIDGVAKFAKTEHTKDSIKAVGDLYQRAINGEKIDKKYWQNAAYAAAADAHTHTAYAAYAAAYAAAAAAAYADAAAYDNAAAHAHAAAAAAAAARQQARIKQADKLVELLQNA